MAMVAIDPGTWAIRLHRYLVVEDCGVVINPMVVDGQVRGGVTQGAAAALLERICFDPDGQPLSATLMDYLAPTAAEMCDVDIVHLQTPSEFSETGAKGMGEGGMIAAPAAVLRRADRTGQAASRKLRGFGLAMFVEKSGLGPQETADVTVSKSGAVHVYSGGTSMGQGIETVLAQIAADALGVDPGSVRVVTGDTAVQPFGAGSRASRSTVVGGNAVHQAATAVRDRAVGAAVANAVRDALGLAGGVGQLPLTPARVRALAEQAGGNPR